VRSALGDQLRIEISDLPSSIARAEVPAEVVPSDSPEFSGPATDLEDIERATIERVFVQVNGDKVLAGKMLGISRATLYRKAQALQHRVTLGRRFAHVAVASGEWRVENLPNFQATEWRKNAAHGASRGYSGT